MRIIPWSSENAFGCAFGKSVFEQYSASTLAQLCFYYGKNGNDHSSVKLVPERFVDEEKFKALLARMRQMGFRYTGEGVFE